MFLVKFSVTFSIELPVKSPNAYKLIENRNYMPAHGITNPSSYTPRKTTFFRFGIDMFAIPM